MKTFCDINCRGKTKFYPWKKFSPFCIRSQARNYCQKFCALTKPRHAGLQNDPLGRAFQQKSNLNVNEMLKACGNFCGVCGRQKNDNCISNDFLLAKGPQGALLISKSRIWFKSRTLDKALSVVTLALVKFVL